MTRRRGERAASAIEMSIVAPVFLLLIFTVVQAALWFYGRNVALTAAREGASHLRLAASAGSTDPSGHEALAEATAIDYARAVGMLHDAGAVATAGVGDDEDYAEVTVTGTVIDLVPFWDLEVSRTVTVRVEKFRPDEGPDQ